MTSVFVCVRGFVCSYCVVVNAMRCVVVLLVVSCCGYSYACEYVLPMLLSLVIIFVCLKVLNGIGVCYYSACVLLSCWFVVGVCACYVLFVLVCVMVGFVCVGFVCCMCD